METSQIVTTGEAVEERKEEVEQSGLEEAKRGPGRPPKGSYPMPSDPTLPQLFSNVKGNEKSKQASKEAPKYASLLDKSEDRGEMTGDM